MKYLKIFEDFERGAYTKISPNTLNRGNQYLQEKYPFLNIDLYEDVDVIHGGYFLYNDATYDSIESLIEIVHENAISIWDYREHEYTINNGLIDVQGEVKISHKNLNKIPYKFGKVSGGFYCTNNQLTTLEGAPHTIEEDFWCRNNLLTTLKGAPNKVGKSLYCDNNKLIKLEGAPHTVGRNFSCNNNKLTTLEGAPEYVGWDFWCRNNQLTNLKYLPEKVAGRIYCENNPNLTDFSDVPKGWVNKLIK